MPYFVYLITNPNGRRYIGLSDDVDRRLQDHNTGVSTWTRHRGPWILTWKSVPKPSLSHARQLESLLKKQKGGRGLTPLLHANGTFLSPGS